jgi:hypothetical protein
MDSMERTYEQADAEKGFMDYKHGPAMRSRGRGRGHGRGRGRCRGMYGRPRYHAGYYGKSGAIYNNGQWPDYGYFHRYGTSGYYPGLNIQYGGSYPPPQPREGAERGRKRNVLQLRQAVKRAKRLKVQKNKRVRKVRTEEKPTQTFSDKKDLASKMKGLEQVPPSHKAKLVHLVWEHREVFSSVTAGSVKNFCHQIELIKNARPPRGGIYPVEDEHLEFIQKEIEKLLQGGYITEVKSSEFLAPIVVVKKGPDEKVSEKKFYIDYRRLNHITKKDNYNIPPNESCLRIEDVKILTKMALVPAFCQVPVFPEDREKTAFSFLGKTYIWLVMPFGLTNAPATFQRIIDEIFADTIGKCTRGYIDNVLVFSKNWDEHLHHLRLVLSRLKEHGLKAALDRTDWGGS